MWASGCRSPARGSGVAPGIDRPRCIDQTRGRVLGRHGPGVVAVVLVVFLAAALPGHAAAATERSSGGVRASGALDGGDVPGPVPDGQDLYRPPADMVPGPAGSLVWYQPTTSPVAGSSAWQFLYRSRSSHGESVLVSGLAIAPAVGAPVDELPILIWAQGTPGLADVCAPSRNLWVPELDRALAAGSWWWCLTVRDSGRVARRIT